jgi:hypothetical protein
MKRSLSESQIINLGWGGATVSHMNVARVIPQTSEA